MPVRIDEVSKFLRRCQNRGLHCLRDQLGGLLALASVYLACRDLVPGFSATLTTIAFGNRSLQWLEAST